MTDVEQFREYAAACMALPEKTRSVRERLAFLELAETWLCSATQMRLRRSPARRSGALWTVSAPSSESLQ
jgi:hypothetical protein